MPDLVFCGSVFLGPLDGVVVALAGPDAHDAFDGDDEDLAVADAAGLRRLAMASTTRSTRLSDHHDFELHLGQEIDDVFGTAIQFGVALLAAETLGLGNGDAGCPDLVKGFLHFVELERLDDRFDLFHV
jgi:hypothetical protein